MHRRNLYILFVIFIFASCTKENDEPSELTDPSEPKVAQDDTQNPDKTKKTTPQTDPKMDPAEAALHEFVKALPPEEEVLNAYKKAEDAGLYPKLERGTSLAGPDLNGDGIRDDIYDFIQNSKWSERINNDQKKALRFFSYALRHIYTVNLDDENALEETSKRITRAINCIYEKFDRPVEISKMIRDFEFFHNETLARYEHYRAYNQKRSGSIITLPSGDTCEDH